VSRYNSRTPEDSSRECAGWCPVKDTAPPHSEKDTKVDDKPVVENMPPKATL